MIALLALESPFVRQNFLEQQNVHKHSKYTYCRTVQEINLISRNLNFVKKRKGYLEDLANNSAPVVIKIESLLMLFGFDGV